VLTLVISMFLVFVTTAAVMLRRAMPAPDAELREVVGS
jgi:hypothetical protein